MTAGLAFDIASELISTDDVLAKYELSKTQLTKIMRTNEFKTLYKEAKLAWDSDPKTRVRAKAQMAVEDGLLPVHRILHDEMMTPQARLDAFKQLTSLADLGPKKEIGDAGGRVAITINVPSVTGPTVIEANANIPAEEDN
jgi:hypothetical protein